MKSLLAVCLAIAATLFVAGESQAQYRMNSPVVVNGVHGSYQFNRFNQVVFVPTNSVFLNSYSSYGASAALLAPSYAPSYGTCGAASAPVLAPSYGYGSVAFNPFFSFNRTIVIRR
jgi:hypothetical protein